MIKVKVIAAPPSDSPSQCYEKYLAFFCRNIFLHSPNPPPPPSYSASEQGLMFTISVFDHNPHFSEYPRPPHPGTVACNALAVLWCPGVLMSFYPDRVCFWTPWTLWTSLGSPCRPYHISINVCQKFSRYKSFGFMDYHMKSAKITTRSARNSAH